MVRSSNYDLYALGMMQTMADENFKMNARSLAFVLFRRGISYDNKNDEKNIWGKI
jgi:hypothetical protein